MCVCVCVSGLYACMPSWHSSDWDFEKCLKFIRHKFDSIIVRYGANKNALALLSSCVNRASKQAAAAAATQRTERVVLCTLAHIFPASTRVQAYSMLRKS